MDLYEFEVSLVQRAQSKSQDSQDYTEKSCLKQKNKKNKNKTKQKSNQK